MAVKKIVSLLIVSVLLLTVLPGCSGVSQSDYDAAVQEAETAQQLAEDLQEQLDNLNEEYQKILAEKEELLAKENEPEPEPETVSKPSSEPTTADAPWMTPLPDGLTAEIQFIDDQ